MNTTTNTTNPTTTKEDSMKLEEATQTLMHDFDLTRQTAEQLMEMLSEAENLFEDNMDDHFFHREELEALAEMA